MKRSCRELMSRELIESSFQEIFHRGLARKSRDIRRFAPRFLIKVL